MHLVVFSRMMVSCNIVSTLIITYLGEDKVEMF